VSGAWRALTRIDPRIVDGLMALAFAAGAMVQLVLAESLTRQTTISALGSTLPLVWRRRYPLAVYLTQIAFDILGGR
jgi:hypothetical protein